MTCCVGLWVRIVSFVRYCHWICVNTKQFGGILCFGIVGAKPEACKRAFLHSLWFSVLVLWDWKGWPLHHHHHHHHHILSYDKSTTSSKTLQRVLSSASPFSFRNILFSLISPSSCLRLLPRLPIPSTFPPVTCLRRQFLHTMWPIHLAFPRYFS